MSPCVVRLTMKHKSRRKCDLDHVPFARMKRVRLDTLLSERGMFPSRSRAAASVLAGEVLLLPDAGGPRSPASWCPRTSSSSSATPPGSSPAAGMKLANALDAPGTRRRPGAGRSTSAPPPAGSPTACCSAGPQHVVAVDVAYGELDWRLRNDAARDGDRAAQRPLAAARRASLRARPDRDRRVVHLAGEGAARVLACAAARFDCLAMVKPQFEVGREQVGKGGVVRDAAARRGALVAVGHAAGGLGRVGARLRQLGAAGPEGQPRDVRVAGRGIAERRRRPGARRVGGRAVNPVRTATVFTHRRPAETGPAVGTLVEMARDAGATLRFDPDGDRQARAGAGRAARARRRTSSATSTSASRSAATGRSSARCAPTPAPACRCSASTTARSASWPRSTARPSARGSGARSRASSRCSRCPGSSLSGGSQRWLAINDVSMHRQPGKRVADLAYGVGEDEVGRVRCDGLVVATPAGSTGYNLANGGPVMAWGVEGFVVSFIAPHSLTARALVVAPGDVLTVHNRSREEPVDVIVDGRPVCALASGRAARGAVRATGQGSLAQVAGATLLPPAAREVRAAGYAAARATRIDKSHGCHPVRSASGSRSGPSGPLVNPTRAPRAARREPAADGAGRAAAGARAQRAHRRDRRRQDAARPRARPAARRPGRERDRARRRRRGLRRGGVRAARGARRRDRRADPRRRRGDRARPPRVARRAHPRVRVRPLGHGRRPARARRPAAGLLRPARAPQADARDRPARGARRSLRRRPAGHARAGRGDLRADPRARAPGGASCASWPARASASSTCSRSSSTRSRRSRPARRRPPS